MRFLIFIFTFVLLSACGKQRIGVNKQVQDFHRTWDSNPTSKEACSSFRYVKPKADFLFLWDNSSSTNHLDATTKVALNNTVMSISQEYDFRILLAPLVTSTPSYVSEMKLVADNPKSLSSTNTRLLIPWDQAVERLRTFPIDSRSSEAGLQRAIELIKYGRRSNIFRRDSKMHIVLMSNQDDNSWHNKNYFQQAGIDRIKYVKDRMDDFKNLKRTHSFQTLRLHSIVNACREAPNKVYREVSRQLYNLSGASGAGAHPDSYDICGNSFINVFASINASVQQILVPHKYNFWPVASSSACIEVDDIQVFKNNTIPILPGSSNGFTFKNQVQTKDTRYYPDKGEPFSGYLIQLHGAAEVVHPECLTVKTTKPKDCFDGIALSTRPEEKTIEVYINGLKIDPVTPSNPKGWELLKESGSEKYYQSYNIKADTSNPFCRSISTDCPKRFAKEERSGYILKLRNMVYTNNDHVRVVFDPLSELR